MKLAYLYSWISPLSLIFKKDQKIAQKIFSQTVSPVCIYVAQKNCTLSPLHFQFLIKSCLSHHYWNHNCNYNQQNQNDSLSNFFRIYLNLLKHNILFCIHDETIILQEIITPANIKLNLNFWKLNANRTPPLSCLLSALD